MLEKCTAQGTANTSECNPMPISCRLRPGVQLKKQESPSVWKRISIPHGVSCRGMEGVPVRILVVGDLCNLLGYPFSPRLYQDTIFPSAPTPPGHVAGPGTPLVDKPKTLLSVICRMRAVTSKYQLWMCLACDRSNEPLFQLSKHPEPTTSPVNHLSTLFLSISLKPIQFLQDVRVLKKKTKKKIKKSEGQ